MCHLLPTESRKGAHAIDSPENVLEGGSSEELFPADSPETCSAESSSTADCSPAGLSLATCSFVGCSPMACSATDCSPRGCSPIGCSMRLFTGSVLIQSVLIQSVLTCSSLPWSMLNHSSVINWEAGPACSAARGSPEACWAAAVSLESHAHLKCCRVKKSHIKPHPKGLQVKSSHLRVAELDA